MNSGYCGIGLIEPKFGINAGHVLRAAGCYNASFVAAQGHRYKTKFQKTDTQKSYRRVPFFNVDDIRDIIPYDCVPVAVDLIDGATSLIEYEHPKRALYIFGPEDGTLGVKTTSWCKDVIYIPTNRCMNLAATVNVVLYDRLFKGGEQTR